MPPLHQPTRAPRERGARTWHARAALCATARGRVSTGSSRPTTDSDHLTIATTLVIAWSAAHARQTHLARTRPAPAAAVAPATSTAT